MSAKKVFVQTGGKAVPIDLRSDFDVAPGERIVEVESKPARRWAALLSLKFDVEFVVETCKAYLMLGEDADSTTRQSFWISSIVMYARCFNQADGRKNQIDANASLKFCSAELKSRHAKTLNTRNQLIAHAGVDIGEQIHVVAVKASAPSEEIQRIGPFVARAILPVATDMVELEATCRCHLNWVDEQIEKTKAKTHEWAEGENRRTKR